jgi:nucleoside-diphosphate-sugar epimerase
MRYVVLGAGGSIGNAVARVAAARGHSVRAVARNPELIPDLPKGVERYRANVLDLAEAVSACKDADVVVHAVNVPYPRWAEVVPRVAANARNAAEAAGATLAFPGNVYPYGPPQRNPVLEDHPFAATTVKGQIRAEIERDYLAAHAAGKLRLVLPRYPDFYGPNVLNGLLAPIFDGAISGKGCRWPIDADLPHEFIFIDDAAEAMLRLVDTPAAHGIPVHVPGPGTIPAREFVRLAYAAGGHPVRHSVFGRGMWRFAGVFNAEVRGAYEMAYLFENPLVLGGSRYDSLVGEARPATPYPEGIRRTVEWFRSPSRGSRTSNRH